MESQGDFITFRVAAFVLRRQRKEILVPDADTDAFLVTKVLENIHAGTGILRRGPDKDIRRPYAKNDIHSKTDRSPIFIGDRYTDTLSRKQRHDRPDSLAGPAPAER